jgi:TPR repeat protein
MYASGRGVKRDYVQGLAWLIVAAKNGADPEGEAQLRAHLLKLRRTEMITAAEERANVIKNELQTTAGPASAGSPADTVRAHTPGSPVAAAAPKTGPGMKTRPSADGVVPGKIPLPVPQVAPVLLPPPPRAQSATPVESGPAVNMLSPLGRPIRWEHFSALERAADKGQPEALSDLAQVLIAGKLVPADPERAVLLLERAVAAGSADGAYQLAEVIVTGVHHPKDEAKAFALYRQAAFGGSPVAMFNVAAFLSQGAGVKRDYTEALAWILLAKKRGVERADVEGRLRAHLQKSAPAQIVAAETRAQQLEAEIAALRK